MQGYLRDWDRMLFIRDGELATKRNSSEYMTQLINIAREKPTELLKIHPLPIDGISVDANGLIRINETLLDGLSDGEKNGRCFQDCITANGRT